MTTSGDALAELHEAEAEREESERERDVNDIHRISVGCGALYGSKD
jgi:hypothetical protein